jgi:hypothetical protein
MQIIQVLSLSPEQYVQQEYHRRIRPPENCPYCLHPHSLKALGYYARFITALLAQVLSIWVRRFLCRHCRHTVSCLPGFAQPYRLVNTPTVQAAFHGENHRPEVQRWKSLTDSIGGAFKSICPSSCGGLVTRLAVIRVRSSIWNLLVKACGSLATATRQLWTVSHLSVRNLSVPPPQAYHAR